MTIKCLGCGTTFENLLDYKEHQTRSNHPDVGEVMAYEVGGA